MISGTSLSLFLMWQSAISHIVTCCVALEYSGLTPNEVLSHSQRVECPFSNNNFLKASIMRVLGAEFLEITKGDNGLACFKVLSNMQVKSK